MSYSERDNLCTVCHRNQQVGILNGVHYDVCRECLGAEAAGDAAAARAPSQYWTEADAAAAHDVSPRRCVHGLPLNVYCGRCEP